MMPGMESNGTHNSNLRGWIDQRFSSNATSDARKPVASATAGITPTVPKAKPTLGPEVPIQWKSTASQHESRGRARGLEPDSISSTDDNFLSFQSMIRQTLELTDNPKESVQEERHLKPTIEFSPPTTTSDTRSADTSRIFANNTVTTPPHQPDSVFMTFVPTLPPASTLRLYDSSPPDYLSPIRTYSADDEAQNHVWDSWGVESVTEKFKLCQKALAVFPFSVDAYNCIGDLYREAIPHQGQAAEEKAEQAYTYAVEAANLLWPELKSQESIDWGYIQLRPFLRAYHGLACLQEDIGKSEESRENLRFLLRVNPADNQGARFLLFYNLIQAGEYHEAEAVAEKHSNGRESKEAYFLWGFVLIDFLKHKLGCCPKEDLEKTLIVALRSNNHVIPLLLTKQKPELPETVSPSCMDEARSIVCKMIGTVQRLTGVLEWMEDTMFRSGMKPDDDGSILFKLLRNGRIQVEMKSGEKIEVTSDVSAMPGRGLDEFCLAPGMKDHNPERIVGFNEDDEGFGLLFITNFTSFSYDDVKSIPFWDVRRRLEKSVRNAEKHYCECCHKDANLQCNACKVAWYCSRECQKIDWKGKGGLGPSHKIMCKKFVKT